MFNKFLPTKDDPIPRPGETEEAEGEGTNLADLILEKIAAHEAAQAGQPVILGGGAPEDAVELPAKVVDVYSKCVSHSGFTAALTSSQSRLNSVSL